MKLTWNKLFNYKDSKFDQLQMHLNTLHMRVICNLKGITLGKNAKFIGLTKIKRSETASILIGINSIFLSTNRSNILNNSRCIIAAIEKNACITIGNNCGFSSTTIACQKKIKIGDYVRCGSNTMITDSDWHIEDMRSGGAIQINIENNVWLGANVVILKGVTIGENALIAANSVVFESIPKNAIAMGNPCKVIFDPAQRNKSRKFTTKIIDKKMDS